jgi:hypothetical protein
VTEEKTIDDVTREDLERLTLASIDLLATARFLFWQNGGDSNSDDKSVRGSLDEAAAALEQIGLKQGTLEEFEANIEAMISSGLSPDEWSIRKRLEEDAAVNSPGEEKP